MDDPKLCSKKCKNTLKTSKGTYTFYNELVHKSESKEICKKHGGIIAPLHTQEEFDAVHKFAYECQPWCGTAYFHLGLYLVKNDTRFYSDCTEWDWEKHDKLYKSYIRQGPSWEVLYRPYDKIQKIYPVAFHRNNRRRTICFNAADESPKKAEALFKKASEDSFYYLSAIVFLASLVVGLALALVKATRSNKK